MACCSLPSQLGVRFRAQDFCERVWRNCAGESSVERWRRRQCSFAEQRPTAAARKINRLAYCKTLAFRCRRKRRAKAGQTGKNNHIAFGIRACLAWTSHSHQLTSERRRRCFSTPWVCAATAHAGRSHNVTLLLHTAKWQRNN